MRTRFLDDMSLIQDLKSFTASDELPAPRWPRGDILTFNKSRVHIEEALEAVLALDGGPIRIPPEHGGNPYASEQLVPFLVTAKVLKDGDISVGAKRLAETVFQRVGEPSSCDHGNEVEPTRCLVQEGQGVGDISMLISYCSKRKRHPFRASSSCF